MTARAVLSVILLLISFLHLGVLISLISILHHLILMESSKSFITVSAKLPIFDLSMISVNSSSFWAAMLSFLLIVALLFSPVSAYADFRADASFSSDFPASLATFPVDPLGTAYITRLALGALGVEIAGSLPQLSPEDTARAMWYGGGSTLPPTYTYIQDLAEYLNRETIKIRPDSVTIGGVEYSDVWLPHNAADKFRTNAFDFTTRYNLSSESTGTFVSGIGFIDGLPIYDNNGAKRSQNVLIPYSTSETVSYMSDSIGIYQRPVSASSTSRLVQGFASPASYFGSAQVPGSNFPLSAYLQYFTGTDIDLLVFDSRGNLCMRGDPPSTISYTAEPFDFNWVSGTIPSEPLPFDHGMRLRVPSTIVSSLPVILDPESSTYESDLSSLISGIESSASDGTLTDPAFEAWDSPVPPANTIANEPYSSLSGALSGISSFLQSISTSVSNVAESILTGDTSFFGNIVSALAAPFEPVFSIFRSGVGIWRYVVSWVGSISAPFSWSLSVLSGAGSIFMTPLYAAAAGAVVLAVYKKFGR